MANSDEVPKTGPASTVVERILDSMDDGVLVIDPGGAIMTCNATAMRVLGLDGEPPLGAGFGETFIVLEGLDDFTQAVLDAVHSESEMGRKVVEVRVRGEPRSLALGTTYLRTGPDDGQHSTGIVAVFTDITEIAALREAEVRLGRQVEAQLRELRDAYRTVEDRNEELAATLRQTRVARAVAGAAMLVVLAAAGVWLWDANTGAEELVGKESLGPAVVGQEPVLWTVETRAMRQTTSVVGRIEPGQVSAIMSPAGGVVRAIHFRYGEEVEQGARLIELDFSATLREYRSVRARHIEAKKRVDALKAWEGGREMASARRQLARAKDMLEQQKRRVEQTAFLFDEGVIPALEHEGAMADYARLREDHDLATRNIELVRAQAGPAAREMAELGYQNLLEQLDDLESVIESAVLHAPVGGIVIAPKKRAEGSDGRLIEGAPVSQGQVLMSIADIGKFSVTGAVEEVEVTKLRVGQAVRMTGDAFPGIELSGELTEIASHAESVTSGASARFAIRADIETPTPEQRREIRVGMSVDLHIVVRDDPAVLTVPFHAIDQTPDGIFVQLRDARTGDIRAVPVETGATTPDAVEIVRGLEAGDQVVLSTR